MVATVLEEAETTYAPPRATGVTTQVEQVTPTVEAEATTSSAPEAAGDEMQREETTLQAASRPLLVVAKAKQEVSVTAASPRSRLGVAHSPNRCPRATLEAAWDRGVRP